ncbi:ATP-binding cassette domain-containing protein [Parvimonas micra]|uniref:ATP-binding cassette domain-containing protein n=1 Tax=Parvimonas micra TaxID=33033 RepID=A0A9X3HCS7_9FIRM|nr:ATP-binding cassette domain-containing protein [Parvimonas micra]MCZ7408087.1 ATP-binding cassette domain-containing protein [Parvimonas micra]MCZ7411229.1 ATP-binding cassette domain-containing protein [Parvimonas micra]MCZ7412852.1 ATP-binding cassette domain-containing protein [Parvimonas micra]WBB36906.1 ATP-binding cassette domain-containing protein [Parvimonas micra]
MLEIKNLTVKYDEIILSNINLKLDKKIYGLKGDSGSGKTTFIKALLGLIEYKGELFLDGEKLKNRKNFQVVFQNPFNSFDSTRKIRFSINEILSLNAVEINLEELANKVGVDTSLFDKYPKELSGGELQRLSIARAISTNPKVLIFDEPTSALDVENQKKILDLIKTFKDKIIIFISHDLKVIKYISDEILILHKESKKINFRSSS